MKRRSLLFSMLVLPLGLTSQGGFASGVSRADIEAMRNDWRQLLPEGFTPPDPDETLELSEQQWRQRLSPAQFDVLREDGTERPFTSPLNGEKAEGIYVCAGCELPLFSSQMKYNSGTGWPSFFTAIPGALDTKRDYRYGWTRIEYHCHRCGGHQGHVFDDGPPPTRERWCNNGVALRFLAKS